ncbi:MAG TPA: class I SAM-dependent rRNA methyltransferase [Candidatus Olsenella pullistercoris]|uniref:Class I SAM-dependent rRNA methyltransferase n=1 Tax=Candidatus Olsenella pullistercoris TaxID=2838712 RepID=A0A9D2EX41_9ACTN|nr:class I SAM-dependent rRNA methyltransferase [Candidatus Olsenella pullistercoris]
MKQTRPYPRIIVTRKAARSLSGGHPWVFEGEVLRCEPSSVDGRPAENGDVVDVFEENGTWQGTGLLSEQSKIRVRLVTRNANDLVDERFWERRVRWAWQHRVSCLGGRGLPGAESDLSCCRVVFSEADGMPGLVVDRYEHVLVAQVGTVGMERLRDTVYPLLLETLRDSGQDVCAIYERNDAPSRAKEGLPLYKGWWDGAPAPNSPVVSVRENGLSFAVDIENSQKTGFFLDQKYNRRAVRRLAHGRRVLDCFCHVGPFGMNVAAGGADFVRCVDVSQSALDLAEKNARLNGLSDRMGFTCANVLDYLPELRRDRGRLREEGGPFDLIVLDPPAFTKSRGTVAHAARGYREINCEALRLLPRGGYLATCSCSHFMTRDLLAKAVADAAHVANVQLKQVEERQQAPDHPILWGFPESHYLDFFIFQVV